MQQEAAIATGGNVVALTVSRSQNRIAYGLDTVHKCFSQSEVSNKNSRSTTAMIEILDFSARAEAWKRDMDGLLQAINFAVENFPSDTGQVRESGDLLYGLENLRKRGQEE